VAQGPGELEQTRGAGSDPDQVTTIESKTVLLNRPVEEVHAFLQDMNNFQQLLPQDRINDWKADVGQCSFKVQGAATIGLQLAGGTPPTLVKMKATDRSPFPFTLDVHLVPENGCTKAHQVFIADLNPFIRMMVEKPLKHLFDHIADQLLVVCA
jgi:carbon monoxide dehydrogenase subunit G